MRQLLILLILVVSAFSANYYVATTGDDGDPGTSGEPWLTITYAETQVSAGDTVFIAAGNYAETVTIDVSGSSGSRIVFVGVGTVTLKNIILNSADYITINNIGIGNGTLAGGYPPGAALFYSDQPSDYVLITGCLVNGYNDEGVDGIIITGSHCRIESTTLKNYADNGGFGGSGTNGIMLGYYLTNVALASTCNSIVNCTMDSMVNPDAAIYFWGDSITISGNTIRNISETDNAIQHVDVFQTYTDNPAPGTTRLLIQKNYVHDVSGQLGFFNNVTDQTSDEWVFVNNIFYNIGMPIKTYGSDDPITNVKFYNNLFYKVGYMYCVPPQAYDETPCSQTSGSRFPIQMGTGTTGEIINNAFIECGDLTGIYYTDLTALGWYSFYGTWTHDYNYAGRGSAGSYAGKGTDFTNGEAHEVNGGDPKFTNEGGLDFHILTTSPLKDVANTLASYATDKDGYDRPFGSAFDIGPYEYRNSKVGNVWLKTQY